MPLFPLYESALKAIHFTGNVALRFRTDELVEINSSFFERVWISSEVPANFRASLRFHTEDNQGKFIIGIGDGERWKPDYHFVMGPTSTAFKKYLEDLDRWDRYLHMSRQPEHLIKRGVTYHVVLQRKNGTAQVYLNDGLLFHVEDEGQDINKYNYLYLAGTLMLEDLTLEPLETQ